MKEQKVILPLLAFVFAVTAVLAVDKQKGWYTPPGNDHAILSTIATPEDTDLNPCLVQAGVYCRIQGEFVFDTEGHANEESLVYALKYN
jgi:hypothetical protein